MFRTNLRKMRSLTSLFVACLTLAGPAAAAVTATCVPDAVNTDSRGAITISCAGTWYFAQPGVCGNTQDSVKMYLSVAQAAILSGKKIDLATPSDAACANHIVFLQLDR